MKNKILNTILIAALLTASSVIDAPKAYAADSWSTGASGGTGRMYAASAQVQNKIYSWGGLDADFNLLNSMDIYNITTNSWSTAASGGSGRFGATATLYNNKIYIYGGANLDLDAFNNVYIYDILTNSWTTGTSGGTAKFAHSATLVDDKIYYYGGRNLSYPGGGIINKLDIYDITNDSWITGADGNLGRMSMTSNLYDNKIYYWAGFNNSWQKLNSLSIYDIASNAWSFGTSGGTARESLVSSLYDEKIYYWGGFGASALNSVDIYDLSTGTWSTGTSGGTGRGCAGTALYDGKIYYVLGETVVDVPVLTTDIYDTGYHPNPEFQNLPGNTVPINLTEGQVVTTPTYTIEVYPTSPNEIEKVEFYVDNVLIDTDYTADEDSIYSTIWDTTLYHSDIRVVAYDPFGRTTELTRTVIVPQDAPTPTPDTTVTELPATGMNAVKFSIFNF